MEGAAASLMCGFGTLLPRCLLLWGLVCLFCFLLFRGGGLLASPPAPAFPIKISLLIEGSTTRRVGNNARRRNQTAGSSAVLAHFPERRFALMGDRRRFFRGQFGAGVLPLPPWLNGRAVLFLCRVSFALLSHYRLVRSFFAIRFTPFMFEWLKKGPDFSSALRDILIPPSYLGPNWPYVSAIPTEIRPASSWAHSV